jgi:hypothetical protein
MSKTYTEEAVQAILDTAKVQADMLRERIQELEGDQTSIHLNEEQVDAVVDEIHETLKSLEGDWSHNPKEFLPANVCCDIVGITRFKKLITDIIEKHDTKDGCIHINYPQIFFAIQWFDKETDRYTELSDKDYKEFADQCHVAYLKET